MDSVRKLVEMSASYVSLPTFTKNVDIGERLSGGKLRLLDLAKLIAATLASARRTVLLPLSFGPISACNAESRSVTSWIHPYFVILNSSTIGRLISQHTFPQVGPQIRGTVERNPASCSSGTHGCKRDSRDRHTLRRSSTTVTVGRNQMLRCEPVCPWNGLEPSNSRLPKQPRPPAQGAGATLSLTMGSR